MAGPDDLGGAATLRRALDVFYARALADAELSVFFLGVDLERLKAAQVHFLSLARHGRSHDQERALRDAHRHARRRGANHRIFDRYVALLNDVISDLGVSAEVRGQLLAAVEAARDSVLDLGRKRSDPPA